MQIPNNLEHVEYVYEQGKFWLSFCGALWAAFKAIEWVKAIRTTDLKQIHDGVDTLKVEIAGQTTKTLTALNDQTTELKELRQDLRTFYAPVAAAASVRRKKSPKKKK